MIKKTNILVIIFLFSMLSINAYALLPIEGIIYGKVKDIRQIDPLRNSLKKEYVSKDSSAYHQDLINSYIGTYKLGADLSYQCEKDPKVNYLTKWDESSASRSVVGTLQYLGLDLSLKAIAHYAKKLEYTEQEYQVLTSNLIENTCSQNLTVYSLKLLKDNFTAQWENNTFGELNLQKNPFFDDYIKKVHNRLDVVKREFNYTIRNFRAFCSWNGDTTDYRMLVPYLKSPFIMSYIINHMTKKKIVIAPKTKELILTYDKDSVQVGCENLICRKRSELEFKRVFPRMIGSNSLREDLRSLYCDRFVNLRYVRDKGNKKIIQWLNEQGYEEPKLETLNFLAQLTKTPDVLILADQYSDIQKFLENNIKFRWDNWANKKVSKLSTDHLYEESLSIKLIEQAGSDSVKVNGPNILINVGLSEMDKLLVSKDKIDAVFNLSFLEKELAYYHDKSLFYFNNSKFAQRQELLNRLVKNIKYQVKTKEKYFKVPIWNERIYGMIGLELLAQIDKYRTRKYKPLSKRRFNVPVRFRFGVFALQYISNKKEYGKRVKQALTFN